MKFYQPLALILFCQYIKGVEYLTCFRIGKNRLL
jgi:hypothetical protein